MGRGSMRGSTKGRGKGKGRKTMVMSSIDKNRGRMTGQMVGQMKGKTAGRGKGRGGIRAYKPSQAKGKGKGRRQPLQALADSKGFEEPPVGKKRASRESNLPNGHTIVLVQYTEDTASKTYSEHDSPSLAMDGLCQMFEQAIKQQMGGSETAKYTVEDLWQFVDELYDLGCLVYTQKSGDYRPHNRTWIKRRVLEHLKSQVKP